MLALHYAALTLWCAPLLWPNSAPPATKAIGVTLHQTCLIAEGKRNTQVALNAVQILLLFLLESTRTDAGKDTYEASQSFLAAISVAILKVPIRDPNCTFSVAPHVSRYL